MHWFAKLVGATAVSCALAMNGAAAKEKKDKTEEKAAGKASKRSDLRDVFPIPVNHTAQGLRVPSFDQTGKLQMYFNIESARRMDDDHLDMRIAQVETYDDDGAPDMTIELPTSVLDLKTRILTSDAPVKIRRSDFELTGDTMTFNTETRFGRIIGNVRMLIFNREAMGGGSGTDETTPGETKSGEKKSEEKKQ